MMRLLSLSIVFSFFMLGTATANDTAYPERDVTLTIPFGAGGATDVASRAIAQGMSERLGVSFIPANRPGAGGTVGPAYVTQQNPDGYRIGILTSNTMELAPYVSQVPFELDDLQFVGAVASYRYGLVVNADSEYQTLEDLITAAKTDDGVFFGASSISPGLAIIRLGAITDGNFETINYKSGAEALSELLGGRVQATILTPSELLPHVKAGTIRLLASAGQNRWPEYPDVPTLPEQGYDVMISSDLAIIAPAGTPAEITDKLREAAFDTVQDPAVIEQLSSIGMDVIQKTAEESRQGIYDNFMANGPVMRELNSDWVPHKCFVDCQK